MICLWCKRLKLLVSLLKLTLILSRKMLLSFTLITSRVKVELLSLSIWSGGQSYLVMEFLPAKGLSSLLWILLISLLVSALSTHLITLKVELLFGVGYQLSLIFLGFLVVTSTWLSPKRIKLAATLSDGRIMSIYIGLILLTPKICLTP